MPADPIDGYYHDDEDEPEPRSLWARLVAWLRHTHVYEPVASGEAEAFEEPYDTLTEQCVCGNTRRRTVKRLVVCLLVAVTGVGLSASEIKDCVNPHPFVPLVTYMPAAARPAMTAKLLPRLPDGTPVPWGTPSAKLILVCGGMSNAAQWCSKFAARLKQLTGSVPNYGKSIIVVPVAQYSITTREWADPNHGAWDIAVQRIQAVGTLAQVVIWAQTHTVMHWASDGRMTSGQVAAVMANAKALAPNIALFLNLDLNYTGFGWDTTNPGGVSVEGIPYLSGTLLKHPPMEEVAHDGELLAAIATTQAGVPSGAEAEYFQVATNGPGTGDARTDFLDVQCHHIQADGVHLSAKSTTTDPGDALIGSNVAERLWGWVPFRSAFPW